MHTLQGSLYLGLGLDKHTLYLKVKLFCVIHIHSSKVE